MGVVRKKPSSRALDTVIFVRHQRGCVAAVSIHLIANYVSFLYYARNLRWRRINCFLPQLNLQLQTEQMSFKHCIKRCKL